MTKDEEIASPVPIDKARGKGGLIPSGSANDIPYGSVDTLDGAAIGSLAGATPAAYLANNAIANVSVLHAAGYAGQGIIVGVIDTGIVPASRTSASTGPSSDARTSSATASAARIPPTTRTAPSSPG